MNISAKSERGQIITFYSYKGGAGRSMAVANCAYWLAKTFPTLRRGILIMDWDLEAPGLHRYFAETAERSEHAKRRGVIDYFDAMRKRLDSDPDLYGKLQTDEAWKVLKENFPLDDYRIPDVVPGVHLIKAGNYDAGYAELISNFNWVDFYQKYGAVFPAFRDLLLHTCDFCLIDSRTGFNDVSGICTMLLPERLVTVFTTNRQSLAGVIDLAGRAAQYRLGSDDPRTLSIFPLPSRVEPGEEKLKEQWAKDYQREFEARFKSIYELDGCDLSEYFRRVLLPHVALYSYGEEIALRREQSSRPGSLRQAYEDFFDKLFGLKFSWDDEAEKVVPVLTTETPALVKPATSLDAIEIYISYSHQDNQSLLEGKQGWIDMFHQMLDRRLAVRIGRSVSIRRDTKLRGNDYFDELSRHRVAESTIFIAIVTPSYMASDWCQRELTEFYDHATKSGGVLIGNRSRVFKVIKTPVKEGFADGRIDDLMNGLLGFQFYEVSEVGRPRELLPEINTADLPKFLERIDDLAMAIASEIDSELRIDEGEALAPADSDLAVYLAETAPDLQSVRDSIKYELQERGYRVLPERTLPRESNALREAVLRDLDRSRLCVQLIGSHYGPTIDDDNRSIVEIQNDLAAARSVDRNLPRIVWLPERVEAVDDLQRQFVSKLHHDTATMQGADLLESSVEELKIYVIDKLQPQSKRLAESTVDSGPVRLYLICELYDVDDVRPLVDYLFDNGIEVSLPLMEGDAAEVREDHRENLMMCDVVMIYYGHGSEGWLRAKIRDLQKAAAFGRTKPFRGQIIYIGPPATEAKQSYRTREMPTFTNFGEFSPEDLRPFFDRIK